MIKHTQSAAVNRKFIGIASDYEINVTRLYIDAEAIRIEYTITPPVPSSLEQDEMPIISWWGYARDNYGRDYQSAGGALGLSDDGKHTNGILSFSPISTELICRLDITMMLLLDGKETDTKCEFSVAL